VASPAPHEIASAVAAVVAAVGGAFATVAAYKSAAAAQQAARHAEQSERRAALREVSNVAALLQATVLGVSSRGAELVLEYRSAEVFSGSAEHSGLRQMRESTEALVEKARSFVPDAQLFSGGARSLADAPFEEVERVRTKLTENLQMVQVIREELDRKYIAMAARNAQHREAILQSKVRP
jgi:hypothetical protein